jgi:lipoprotein NlpI
MNAVPENARRWIVALALMAPILFAYWQAGEFSFVSLDDDQYVYENPHVQQGLTAEGAAWAFTTFEASNWHPLTWLSHMADVELFSLDAGWHHRVNLLLHLLNTALLFLVLREMTGGLWQSAFVAGLFGVHPLHVESVAWVAERKDLLSTLFWILTMGAYVRYVRSPGVGRYLLMAAFFAAGLMCKPMIVTLPFVLLLLDWWPLKRFGPERFFFRQVSRLVREKIPLLALSAASCVITIIAQIEGGAVKLLSHVPPGLRISNAIVSYVKYLEKAIWPASLAVFYPHPGSIGADIPAWHIAGAVLLLVVISYLVLREHERRPFLAVGWLWYLGTLVPVIGFVQVGGQALADRYTYVPLTGIFLLVAWGGPEVFGGWRYRKVALSVAFVVAVAALIVVTRDQASTWRNNFRLFGHALRVTEKNWLAWNNLGVAYGHANESTMSIACYLEAVRVKPDYAKAYNNLGIARSRQGLQDEAEGMFRYATRLDPEFAAAYYNLGRIYLVHKGDYVRAIDMLQMAVTLKPNFVDAFVNMAAAYNQIGEFGKAVGVLENPLVESGRRPESIYHLGVAYRGLRNTEAASRQLERLREKDPALASRLERVIHGPPGVEP